MFRLAVICSVVMLLAVPAYAGWGCGSGGGYYGGYYSGPVYSYGPSYSCGSYYTPSYYSCNSYVVKRGCFGGYRVYSVPTYYYYNSNSCTPSTVTSPAPATKVEAPQESLLPKDYYEEPEPTPAQKPEPAVDEDKPEPPAESFQSTSTTGNVTYTSYKPTTAPKTGSGILVLRCPADAKVYINGYETKKTGTLRKYVSHNLKHGYKYKYEVVVVRNDGKRFKGLASLKAGQTLKLN